MKINSLTGINPPFRRPWLVGDGEGTAKLAVPRWTFSAYGVVVQSSGLPTPYILDFTTEYSGASSSSIAIAIETLAKAKICQLIRFQPRDRFKPRSEKVGPC